MSINSKEIVINRKFTAVVKDIRTRTNRPFNMNLWVPIPGQDDYDVTPAQIARAFEPLRPWFARLGVAAPAPPARPDRFVPEFSAQVEALLAARPPVFSFVMGIPDAAVLREARRQGIVTMGTATTVDEAVAIYAAKGDIVSTARSKNLLARIASPLKRPQPNPSLPLDEDAQSTNRR